MKKVLFSAFALCVFTGTAFAEGSESAFALNNFNSTKIVEVEPCVWNMTILNRRKEVVGTIKYEGTAPGKKECKEWADTEVAAKNKELAQSGSGRTASHDL